MGKTYKITFQESSDYGQDVMNLAGLVATLMDDETPKPKYELYRTIDELIRASTQLRKDVFNNKEPYFTGEEGA